MSQYYSSSYGSPAGPSSSSLDPNTGFYAPSAHSQHHPQAPHQQAQQPSFYSNRPSMDPDGRPDLNALAGAIGGNIGGGAGGGGGSTGAGAGGGGTGLGTVGGPITVQNWWNAFTPWTGMEGEAPLLEGLFFSFFSSSFSSLSKN